ncbi:hypothetical protein EW146_g8144 [Bondarzewia mesenterica]|uniref:N-acetyltransferase domain-containing protein n=1 Tax=Bondarzewia mesenterica TaxID=1095465 RepID=A0A4S4LHB1_9AGAM|nr:hypothetical protein EW146_g8144 [Bondarzewia mesenterica]
MSFINSYKPPQVESLPGYYGPDPYDINFVFPINLSSLETERVKLTPLIPSIHVQTYADQVNQHPELQRWLPFGHKTVDEILSFVEMRVRRDPGWVMFAVIDKGRPDPAHPEFEGGSMAGVIGLISTSAANLSTEVGWVVTFPAFQRTHVTSHAVGLLLRYCLEPASAPVPGLGLRRVQWTANTRNIPSITAAQRTGFKLEGTLRWTWVLPEGKEGHVPRKNDPKSENPGRDSAMLSICCDDWENGGREHVKQLLDRQ